MGDGLLGLGHDSLVDFGREPRACSYRQGSTPITNESADMNHYSRCILSPPPSSSDSSSSLSNDESHLNHPNSTTPIHNVNQTTDSTTTHRQIRSLSRRLTTSHFRSSPSDISLQTITPGLSLSSYSPPPNIINTKNHIFLLTSVVASPTSMPYHPSEMLSNRSTIRRSHARSLLRATAATGNMAAGSKGGGGRGSSSDERSSVGESSFYTAFDDDGTWRSRDDHQSREEDGEEKVEGQEDERQRRNKIHSLDKMGHVNEDGKRSQSGEEVLMNFFQQRESVSIWFQHQKEEQKKKTSSFCFSALVSSLPSPVFCCHFPVDHLPELTIFLSPLQGLPLDAQT